MVIIMTLLPNEKNVEIEAMKKQNRGLALPIEPEEFIHPLETKTDMVKPLQMGGDFIRPLRIWK